MTHRFLSPTDVRARVENKGTRFATVTFVKKDGSIRTKNGLFKPLSHIKGTGRKTPDGYIAIYSPNEERWGMFAIDKVVEIK